MSRGFPTVSDKAFGKVKQESQGPIIGRCPLSLAGKLEYVYLLSRSKNNPLSKAGGSRATKKCRTQPAASLIAFHYRANGLILTQHPNVFPVEPLLPVRAGADGHMVPLRGHFRGVWP
jgi:hypothetical protein